MSTRSLDSSPQSAGGATFLSLDDLSAVVHRVQAGDSDAQGTLYTQIISRFRGLFARRLTRADVEDCLQNLFLMTVTAIRANRVLDPHRLPGFVKTIAIRQALNCHKPQHRTADHQVNLESIATHAPSPDQESELLYRERQAIMMRELQLLCWRDREVLIRYYFREHSKEQICQDLSLSDTQFRLLKSRAKAKLANAVSASRPVR